MTQAHLASTTVITRGQPRFADAGKAGERAWLELLAPHGRLIDGLAQGLASVQGDFAVALTTDSGATLLAVDRFAQQTLCYRMGPQGLRFDERADALAGASELDPQAIFDYLYFHCIPSPRTIFKEVLRLPPGHYALYQNGRLTVARYWSPCFDATGPTDFASLKQEFLSHLQGGVRHQLDGSKPACFLSGGTDSSTVAGMIARETGSGADSYSIGFDAEGYDEMAYARLAARHFGTRHHEYYVTPDDLVRGIPEMAAHLDQPFGNSSVLPAYYCAKMARQDGVSRLLAGDGGDELYGGNSRYAKQRLFDLYQQVPGLLQRGLLEPLLLKTPLGKLPLLSKGASYVEQAAMPMPDRLQLYNLITRVGPSQVLTPAMLSRIDLTAPLRHQQASWREPAACSPLNRELAFDWRYTLAESDLPKVRAATALGGVSVGFPMLDDALLSLSLRLPDDYKLKGQQLRWFFKEALRGFLPDEIISKRKQGFGLPFGVWTTRTPALRAMAEDSLRGLAGRGVVRADYISQLFDRQLPAHPGYYGEMVWILMMLEQWLRAKAPAYKLG
ncbi:asparagine synthetase B family protein [Paucibacter sp. XJ19-41]|uniref:asparagine synthetase B family protein n=1 Tax=Paucibacter sp. XJ19-41 TaxID=2927824 RepID=UPI00234A655B|nr:asparagine synthase C-terminal domain-containing protein [Paucibacter sp. XJ19-41]MDC6166103.1 asparagine synthase C-terminal domain-containing protein [Paucibacter sp. XJ19-41]